MDLEDPIAVALIVSESLASRGLPHALYGALALAAYGEARQTRDADFCVLDVTATQAAATLRERGLELQIAFEDMVFGGLAISRLTLLPGGGHTGSNTVDLVAPRSHAYAKRVLERSLDGPLRGQELRLVGPEDFVLLKVLSTRDRDLSDAAGVLSRLEAQLDWSLLRTEAAQLASDVIEHDVAGRYARACEMAKQLDGG